MKSKPLLTKRTRIPWIWVTSTCTFVLLVTCFYKFQPYILVEPYKRSSETSESIHNYFLSSKDVAEFGYIVHTPKCSILNLTPWNEETLPFLIEEDVPAADCAALEPRQWTYTTNSHLVINETGMHESGYSLSSVSCCYYAILRVAQTIHNYDKFADSKMRYSSDCTLITEIFTPMSTSYVRVQCIAKYWPFSSDILYRRFHALPFVPTTPQVTEKVNYWKSTASAKPPNVLIVGIDGMSRLSFHRTMPRTRTVLRELGAVELLGYTKVGENTFPITVASLSGYSEEVMRRYCLLSNDMPMDYCTNTYFLFKRYSQAKYITAFIEDGPRLGIFNYKKTGFIAEPTDIYFRPLMLAAHYHDTSDFATLSCLGHDSEEGFILRHVHEIATMYRTYDYTSLPYFLFSWLTTVAHDNIMKPKYVDETYAEFFKNFNLTHTIMLFLSDHGTRYGSIRQTFPGYYEDKLPTMWIYLPSSLRKSHPHWLKSIQLNAEKLTSSFDLFWTLSQVLDEFTKVPPLPELQNKTTTKEIRRQYGQSLFAPVASTRNCSEVGISQQYCVCLVPKRLSISDIHLRKAAEAAIGQINLFLPKECAKAKLLSVDAGAQLESGEDVSETKTYVVAFQTLPGHFLFEATVICTEDYENATAQYRLNFRTDILRMNRISTDVSCVHDQFLERLCYCVFN